MADLRVLAQSGAETILSEAVVKEFRGSLRGRLLLAVDDGYDAARKIWNGMIDRRPALIARCAGAADVVRCVDFARAHNCSWQSAAAGTTSRAMPCAMAGW